MRRNGKRALLFTLLSLACVTAVLGNVLQPSNESVKQRGIRFIERAWEDVLHAYELYSYLEHAYLAHAAGKLSEQDFNDYCKYAEKNFGRLADRLHYGRTNLERAFLGKLRTFALANQQASRHYMAGLNSRSGEALAEGKEYHNVAMEAIVDIGRIKKEIYGEIRLTENEIAKLG